MLRDLRNRRQIEGGSLDGRAAISAEMPSSVSPILGTRQTVGQRKGSLPAVRAIVLTRWLSAAGIGSSRQVPIVTLLDAKMLRIWPVLNAHPRGG